MIKDFSQDNIDKSISWDVKIRNYEFETSEFKIL